MTDNPSDQDPAASVDERSPSDSSTNSENNPGTDQTSSPVSDPQSESGDLCLTFLDHQGNLLETRQWNRDWGSAVIGRSSDCTITIKEPSISREHCVLIRTGSILILEDLESRNGTFIEGSRMLRHTLQDGESFRIGRVTVQIKQPQEESKIGGEEESASTVFAEEANEPDEPEEDDKTEEDPEEQNEPGGTSIIPDPPPLTSISFEGKGKKTGEKSSRRPSSRTNAGTRRAIIPSLYLFGAGILFGWLLLGLASLLIYLSPLTLQPEEDVEKDKNQSVQKTTKSRPRSPVEENRAENPDKPSRTSRQRTSSANKTNRDGNPQQNRKTTSREPQPEWETPGSNEQPNKPNETSSNSANKDQKDMQKPETSNGKISRRNRIRKDRARWNRLLSDDRTLRDQFKFKKARIQYKNEEKNFETTLYRELCRYRQDFFNRINTFFNNYLSWAENGADRVREYMNVESMDLPGPVKFAGADRNGITLQTGEGEKQFGWNHDRAADLLRNSLYVKMLDDKQRYTLSLLELALQEKQQKFRTLERMYRVFKDQRPQTKKYLAMLKEERESEIGFKIFNGRWMSREKYRRMPKQIRKLVGYYEDAERWAMKTIILIALMNEGHPEVVRSCMDAIKNGKMKTKIFAMKVLGESPKKALRSGLTRSAMEQLQKIMKHAKYQYMVDRIQSIFSRIAEKSFDGRREAANWWESQRETYRPTPWKANTTSGTPGDSSDASGNETVAAPDEPPVSLYSNILEIVICVDATGSMGGPIEQASKSLRTIMTILKGTIPDARIGLVLYRDTDGTSGPPAKLAKRLTDNATRIRRRLRATETRGGGDPEELVSMGLEVAIDDRMGWTPEARKGILVMGDSPPKYPDRAVRMANLAQKKGKNSENPEKYKPITVNCVGVSSMPNAFPRVAREGGGKAVTANNADTLVREMVKLGFHERWYNQVNTLLDWALKFKEKGILDY